MSVLVALERNKRKVNYVEELTLVDLGVSGEDPVEAELKLLKSFFSTSRITTLRLTILHGFWLFLSPLHQFLPSTLTSLHLKIMPANFGRPNYHTNDSVSIADIPSVLNLTELTAVYIESDQVSTFLGPGIRKNLKKLSLYAADSSSISPFFRLSPNLSQLKVMRCSNPDLLESVSPSIKRLGNITSPNLAELFRNTSNQPVYLTHIEITCEIDFDYSTLPFIPYGVQETTIYSENLSLLGKALKLFRKGDFQFRLIRMEEHDPSDESPASEPVSDRRRKKVAEECKRLGIEWEWKKWMIFSQNSENVGSWIT